MPAELFPRDWAERMVPLCTRFSLLDPWNCTDLLETGGINGYLGDVDQTAGVDHVKTVGQMGLCDPAILLGDISGLAQASSIDSG